MILYYFIIFLNIGNKFSKMLIVYSHADPSFHDNANQGKTEIFTNITQALS